MSNRQIVSQLHHGERLRWFAWRHLIRLPRVCPANAHSRIIWRIEHDDGFVKGCLIDDMCRRDCAANDACWCGKLRADA